MKRTFTLSLLLLLAFVLATPSAQAQVPAELVKSFTKLTTKSDKLMGKINPWMDTVKMNDALIPGNLRPQYDAFSKTFGNYSSKLSLLKADPSKLTSDAISGLTGDLGNLSTSFKGIQGAFKGLPFMK